MVLVHDYEIKIKGVKKKVIYHLSDLHLATYDELSSTEEIGLAKKQTEGWAKTRRDFAERFSEPYEENEQFLASEHFEALIKKATEDGDCLVFAGDIFDYINDPQIRFFEKRIEKIKIPYIFAAGNHEETEKIPDISSLAKIKAPIQVLTIDDITIIALDNSKKVITRETKTMENPTASPQNHQKVQKISPQNPQTRTNLQINQTKSSTNPQAKRIPKRNRIFSY